MSATDVLFYLIIGTALAFDFTNGFHAARAQKG